MAAIAAAQHATSPFHTTTSLPPPQNPDCAPPRLPLRAGAGGGGDGGALFLTLLLVLPVLPPPLLLPGGITCTARGAPGLHRASHTLNLSKLLLLPPQPPQTNCSHVPLAPLQNQRGMLPRHRPVSGGRLQETAAAEELSGKLI